MDTNKNAEETASKFKFYDALEMEERPAPEQLVEGILPIGGFGELFGAPGIGKSFILLDIAFSVATGTTWHSRKTKCVPVVYVLAEGAGAIGRRIAAWRQYHNLSVIPNIHFLPEILQLNSSADIQGFIKALETLPSAPGLIIIDTLSRCIPGVEENSSKEMGVVVQHIDKLRQATGAAVLICHHTTKGGKEDRGSSVIRGAADVMLFIRPTDKHSLSMHVECDKAKDLPEFKSFVLVRTSHVKSCVVTWGGIANDKSSVIALPYSQRRLLEILALAYPVTKQVSSGDLKKLSGLKRTFYDAIRKLVADGYVFKEKVLGITTYTITPTGAEVLRGLCESGANATSAQTDQPVRAIPPSLEGDCSSAVTESSAQQAGDEDEDSDLLGEGVSRDLP